jgi:hypothetical protein
MRLLWLTTFLCFAGVPVWAQVAEQPGKLDWPRFRAAFGAFLEYPSPERAKAARVLLPAGHVSYTASADQRPTIEMVYQGLPMLERQVQARDPEAVQLAFDLFAIADGAFAEDLGVLVGELIRIDPQLFLMSLHSREARFRDLGLIVGNLGEPYVDRTRAGCFELRLRIASLESVHQDAVSSVRKRCIQELKEQARECP